MDPGPGDELNRDDGLASVEFLVAACLALLTVVWLADALVVRYADGVMGTAARQAARAGSLSDDPGTACRAEADTWLGDALGGAMRDGVTVECHVSATAVTVSVSGRFDAWLPGVPAWVRERSATAVREP